jgi:adenosine deaminase
VQEEAYRRLAFKLNHEKIKANNEKNNSRFSMKMNKFGAMTQQEFKDIMLKATPPPLG